MTTLVTSATDRDVASAMKCLSAWITFGIPANHLTPLVPFLINLLNSPDTFVPAVDALDALLSSSTFGNSAGTKTLTEPLLTFLNAHGPTILQTAIASVQDGGMVDEVPHALARLVAALADHSVSYIIRRLAEPSVQGLLRLLLGFQSFPGYYGVDEEESELVLPFWYLLQEALWDASPSAAADQSFEELEDEPPTTTGVPPHLDTADLDIAQALYTEVVAVLRRKATWPPQDQLRSWTKGLSWPLFTSTLLTRVARPTGEICYVRYLS